MPYYSIILLCLNFISIKEYGYFNNFEKRLIKVSVLLSVSFVLFTTFSFVSIHNLAYGSLLVFFNGPLLYYLLFNKVRAVLFQLYIIVALLCLYFFGFTLFGTVSIENMNLFTSILSALIGLTYAIYCMFFQTSTNSDFNTIKKITCIALMISSILYLPFISKQIVGADSTLIFMFNYTVFIVWIQIFLARRYNQIKKEIRFELTENEIVVATEPFININQDNELIEDFIENNELKSESEAQTTGSLLNIYLIENKMFLNPNLTLDDVAFGTKISKPQLTAYFKKTQASNFNQYVNRLRVEYAVILLQDIHHLNEEDISIEQLALQSGFNSRVTFYRAFVGIYGFPPSELIKN